MFWVYTITTIITITTTIIFITTTITIMIILAVWIFIGVLLHSRQGDATGGERVGERLQGETHLVRMSQSWSHIKHETFWQRHNMDTHIPPQSFFPSDIRFHIMILLQCYIFFPVFPFIVHIQNQYRYKNVISHLKGRGALGQASLASLAGSSQARNRCWLHIVRQASIWTLKLGCRILSRWVWIEPGKALPLSSSPGRWSACHNAVHLPIRDNNEWVMSRVSQLAACPH